MCYENLIACMRSPCSYVLIDSLCEQTRE
ncbi:hypothetical protein F383_24185 [Gossypium arboreum]|uniref:Uncharacterized protein n=1 Tax=Gossypium arboreum TaxID=29729 RepID=A0A0B0MRB9_GOSAR|nr:hypothetical protein F383_24185 [Gossypium arboreum]